MDPLSCPNVPILEIFQDIDLPGPLRGTFKPAIPVPIIGKPVWPGTGSKDFIPRFRPGELILELGHRISFGMEIGYDSNWSLINNHEGVNALGHASRAKGVLLRLSECIKRLMGIS